MLEGVFPFHSPLRSGDSLARSHIHLSHLSDKAHGFVVKP